MKMRLFCLASKVGSDITIGPSDRAQLYPRKRASPRWTISGCNCRLCCRSVLLN